MTMVTAATLDAQPRYQNLPPLSPNEYATLKNSIRDNGLYEPIVVDEENHILDGHHRARVCLELGIEPATRVLAGLTEEEKRTYAFWVNFARRHLSKEQKREAILAVEAHLKENPAQSDREIARTLGIDKNTVNSRRDDLEAAGAIPAVRRPHSRYPAEDSSAHTTGDSPDGEARTPLETADHRRMMYCRLIVGYPAPSQVERMRGALPYTRESERKEWPSGDVYLSSPLPTDRESLTAVWQEIAEATWRRHWEHHAQGGGVVIVR